MLRGGGGVACVASAQCDLGTQALPSQPINTEDATTRRPNAHLDLPSGTWLGVFFGLGLMLAAPFCWVAAMTSSEGDRWTLGYIGGWAVYFLVGYVTSAIEDGSPIKVSDHAVNWGFAAVAVLYLGAAVRAIPF